MPGYVATAAAYTTKGRWMLQICVGTSNLQWKDIDRYLQVASGSLLQWRETRQLPVKNKGPG